MFELENQKRFWSKIIIPNQNIEELCWNWSQYTDKDGYGTFYHNSVSTKAHRYVYQLYNNFITSNIEVHKEVIGDSAIFIGPNDNEKLSHYLKTLYSDQNLINSLKEKTHSIQNKYCWSRTAEETLNTYKQILT